MPKVIENPSQEPIIMIEEKGDIKHAIRCTEQALKRAQVPWMKQACAYRLKMLQVQLVKQQGKD